MYSYEETLELLQRAVAEKGDGHVVADCVYADHERQPVCIVGQVLSYVGLLDQAIANVELVGALPVVQENFTLTAIRALDIAQTVQDGCLLTPSGTTSGRTWGEALIAAKEVAP